jgi:hypothetical protein
MKRAQVQDQIVKYEEIVRAWEKDKVLLDNLLGRFEFYKNQGIFRLTGAVTNGEWSALTRVPDLIETEINTNRDLIRINRLKLEDINEIDEGDDYEDIDE